MVTTKNERVLSLDGIWSLAIDPNNTGKEAKWFAEGFPANEAADAPVPGIVQQVFYQHYGVSWYKRSFSMDSLEEGLRYAVQFDSVDYYVDVYVNGNPAGSHEGEDIPFEMDITGLVQKGDNTIVVRVINPVDDQTIDGLNFLEIPRTNRTPRDCSGGGGFNQGGIVRSIRIVARPAVYIADVYAHADPFTGVIRIEASVVNTGTAAVCCLDASASVQDARVSVKNVCTSVNVPAGRSTQKIDLHIANRHLWNLDDPYLYTLAIGLQPENSECCKDADLYTLRVGFKDFRVINGFFYLNGKRIFLKSSHTGNNVPIGNTCPVDPDLIRRDLILMKATGFNCIRFISSNAIPAQLDFCDELGFLVYEESRPSWLLAETPRMAEHYDRSFTGTIMRGRSHACVAIWGLLNETYDGAVYRHAVAFLQTLRKMDMHRLVLLASGRWDLDLKTGGVSNPESMEWEYQWGDERPDHPGLNVENVPVWIQEIPMTPWVPGSGDVHSYPKIPFNDETINGYLYHAKDTKPIFLSESGAGSQYNFPGELKRFMQAGPRPMSADRAYIEQRAARYETDFKKYRLDDVYPFSEDMFIDTYAHQTENRRFVFDLIRANPKVCGYNVTGLLDHAMAGEGLWSLWREFKPGMMDVLEGGFARLRFSLFVRPFHVYAGTPFRVFVSVDNEDELTPGEYPVTMKIHGGGKTLWENTATLRIPETSKDNPAPFSFVMFDGDVTLPADTQAGRYTLAADIDGAHPRDRQIGFTVSNLTNLPQLSATVVGVGLDSPSAAMLESHGVKTVNLKNRGNCAQVMVGGEKLTEEEWAEVLAIAENGGHVAFMNAKVFEGTEGLRKRLPFASNGIVKFSDDWLYHKDNVLKPSVLSEGLDKPGVMRIQYYDKVFGHDVFENMPTPDATLACAFATCYPVLWGYTSYLITGTYTLGKGKVTLNGLDICQNIGNPAADRMLLNMAKYLNA